MLAAALHLMFQTSFFPVCRSGEPRAPPELCDFKLKTLDQPAGARSEHQPQRCFCSFWTASPLPHRRRRRRHSRGSHPRGCIARHMQNPRLVSASEAQSSSRGLLAPARHAASAESACREPTLGCLRCTPPTSHPLPHSCIPAITRRQTWSQLHLLRPPTSPNQPRNMVPSPEQLQAKPDLSPLLQTQPTGGF